ncbi:replication initiator protein [Malaciobacter marinus]|jgi:plasmid replication initiation protein|uniref:Replication initiator protein n=1 Tax=Malaciobacter marinus TaxID=505249 RepID=A0AB36ZS24_9BACT|nr:replication initiation protein [Malaciobacter marinus]PPK57331.1 replication initiator protein [Malaciobacter marinus]
MFEKKDYIVRKHNHLVNSSREKAYSPLELKLIAKVISLVTPDYKNLLTERIYLRDLEFISNETKNHNYYKKIFEILSDTNFFLPCGGKVKWFSYLNIHDGFIEYAFNESLKDYIVQLNSNNRQYYLSNILALNSRYSIHIYELLNQMRDKKGREVFIEDLIKVLNIPASYNITNIAKKVLDTAKEELEEKTDLSFEYSFIKQGRKISKVKFAIKGSLHSRSQIKERKILL